jgi:hypothetical protein
LDREHWVDINAGQEQRLSITATDPAGVHEEVCAAVADSLTRIPNLRFGAARWVTEGNLTAAGLSASLSQAFQRVWDGMARLPFTDEQLVAALAQTTALAIAYEQSGHDRRATAEGFDQGFKIELAGGGENVHAFAWANEAALRKAVRDDFPDLLAESERENVLALTFNVVISARNPRLLFDFDRLTDLFARQLIPTEVALDADNPTFFSPARLDVLGPD